MKIKNFPADLMELTLPATETSSSSIFSFSVIFESNSYINSFIVCVVTNLWGYGKYFSLFFNS